jgi:hypothetical protein
MLDNLTVLYNTTCSSWEKWLETFDKFIDYNPRDSDDKMYKYRHSPDYCTWKHEGDIFYTFSYKYVHAMDVYGNMFCFQKSTKDKTKALLNYSILFENCDQNILPKLIEYKIIDDQHCYTHFKSPSIEIGYPTPYSLFNIMMNSKDVIKDFKSYITNLVDNYCKVLQTCINQKLDFYAPNHLLINHFADDNLFSFKDTMFYYISKEDTIKDIADKWYSSIDGFRRAQGIIDAYKNRSDSDMDTVSLLFDEIENLKKYSRNKCLNLIKQNQ